MPQRVDRIEARGAPGREEAEDHADGAGKHEGQGDDAGFGAKGMAIA